MISSTLVGYRSVNRALIAEFGDANARAAITPERIESYRARLLSEGRLSRRQIQKLLTRRSRAQRAGEGRA